MLMILDGMPVTEFTLFACLYAPASGEEGD